MTLTQTGNYREKIDILLGQYIFHNARSVLVLKVISIKVAHFNPEYPKKLVD